MVFSVLVFLVFLVLVFLVFLVWFFGILGFGFLVVSRERVVVYFKSFSTATPISVRVDSDVVQQAYLNCPKRSGRV